MIEKKPWECPKCGGVNADWVDTCPHCLTRGPGLVPPFQPYIPTFPEPRDPFKDYYGDGYPACRNDRIYKYVLPNQQITY